MTRLISRIALFSLLGLAGSIFAAAQIPADPIYIRTQDGWKGLFGIADEYAEYSLKGSEIKLQDPYHALLKPSLGLMVTFAAKSQIGGGNDLLSDHLQWELDHWRQHASRVESVPRNELAGGRNDLRVTEIRLFNGQGKQTNVYMIALAAKSGVFVISVSPVDSSVDLLVAEIAASFKLVGRPLDGDEVKRISLAERAGH